MRSVAALSATVAVLSGSANAFWRMQLHSRTGLERIDPVVDFGKVSSHAHALHGGSNLGIDASFQQLRDSECTSAAVPDDKSGYWTPPLYFRHASNGSLEVVPQVGGMLAYYLLVGENIQAFPEEFQMLAGDSRQRNFTGRLVDGTDPPKSLWNEEDKTQFVLGQKAIGMNCLNYAKDPEPSMYRHGLPTKEYMDQNCPQGLRAEIFFPSCWDGKNATSANHKDHVAYPDTVNDGKCPDGFKTRIPSLFYETIWNTAKYNTTDGEFVFGNGDPTGFGYHGDFIMGWDKETLQNAVGNCTNPSGRLEDCPVFLPTLQTEAEQDKCKLAKPMLETFAKALGGSLDDDNCAGPSEGLCGNVPIQYGPGYASKLEPGNMDPITALPTSAPTLVSSMSDVPYTTAKSMFSGIPIMAGGQGGAPSAAPVQPKPAATSEVVSSVTPAPEAPAPAAPEAPAPTEPPAADEPETDTDGRIIGTSTYTSAGVVHEVVIEQVDVYVTMDTPAPPKLRRHAHHKHHRRDKEHGLLGRL